jgi:hypothetical protein
MLQQDFQTRTITFADCNGQWGSIRILEFRWIIFCSIGKENTQNKMKTAICGKEDQTFAVDFTWALFENVSEHFDRPKAAGVVNWVVAITRQLLDLKVVIFEENETFQGIKGGANME